MSKDERPEVGEVTAIDVVDLSGLYANRVDQYMIAARDRPGVRLAREEAERVLSLYQALPPGDGARCHTPPYGLRMFREQRTVCEVSICWQCNNMFGEANGQPFCIRFDSSSSPAQKLLSELLRAVGGALD